MTEQPIPLERERERVMEVLSQHFAQDHLTIDEFERRIEQVYRIDSPAALRSLTQDLPDIVSNVPAARPLPTPSGGRAAVSGRQDRILSIMSETTRTGPWLVPPHLDVTGVMSDTKIDLTHAVMPVGVVDFEVRAIMASLKVIVPPGMRVIIDTHSVMSNVRSRADELPPEDAPATGNAPVVRITGFALMSDVNIVVRRREDTAYYDDDDDD